jgi:hypothetical protein
MKTPAALLLLLPTALGGCATSPVALEHAKPVPAERLLAYGRPEPGRCEVVVIRDGGGMITSMLHDEVRVDGTPAVLLDPGEAARLWIPEGDHVFGVVATPSLFGRYSVTENAVHVSPFKTTYLRVYATHEDIPMIGPTAEFR